jgi:hypothetical protein
VNVDDADDSSDDDANAESCAVIDHYCYFFRNNNEKRPHTTTRLGFQSQRVCFTVLRSQQKSIGVDHTCNQKPQRNRCACKINEQRQFNEKRKKKHQTHFFVLEPSAMIERCLSQLNANRNAFHHVTSLSFSSSSIALRSSIDMIFGEFVVVVVVVVGVV